MPNAATVRTLIATRWPRSLDAWRERVEAEIHDTGRGGDCVALVQIMRLFPDDERYSGAWTRNAQDVADAGYHLRIGLLRHLGRDEFIVRLDEHQDQNQLALGGHLDVTRDRFRMIAL